MSSDNLPPFEVPSVRALDGSNVKITDLYKHRKIVLVFLRHLSCRFCYQLADEISTIKDKLAGAEVGLCAVSLGTEEQAAVFLDKSKFQGELYIETDSAPNARYFAYESFKLKRDRDDFVASMDKIKVKGLEAQRAGYTDTPHLAGSEREWSGDWGQVGGVFVVGPGNVCDYSFRSEYAGDHPNVADVLEAATGTASTGEHIFPSTKAWFNRLKAGELAPNSGPARAPHSRGSSQETLTKQGNDTSNGSIPVHQGVNNTVASVDNVTLAQPRQLSPPLFVTLLLLGALAVLATRARYRRLGTSWLEAHPFFVGNALAVIILILALWHRSYSAPPRDTQGSTRVSTTGSKVDDSGSACPFATPSLYSPKDIDTLVLDSGLIDCDCNGVMDNIPVDSKSSPSPPPTTGRSHALSVDPSAEEELTQMVARAKAHSVQSTESFVHDTSLAGDVTSSLEFFRQTTCYLREFLAKPHPMVGRPGPVCPFVPSALKMDTIKLACVRTPKRPNKEDLKKLIKEYLGIFTKMEPSKGRKKLYKAILLIFPDIEDQDASEYIDQVQYEMKPDFVDLGLMLGEFHINNNTHGLHNQSFYPLRTPHPVLAIRHMAPTDIVFLDMDQYPPARRIKFLESYISQFENDPKESQKREVQAAITALEDARRALQAA